MGSSPHSRLVRMTRSTIEQKDGKYVQLDKPITPLEAWDSVYSEEGYEDGHSYSGTFGSKPGVVIVVHDQRLTKEMVAIAGQIMEDVNDGEPDFAAMSAEKQAVLAIIPPVKFVQANALYDDKWEAAVGFAGAEYVWFGGWCPS